MTNLNNTEIIEVVEKDSEKNIIVGCMGGYYNSFIDGVLTIPTLDEHFDIDFLRKHNGTFNHGSK